MERTGESKVGERAPIVERAIQALVDFHEYPATQMGIARTMVVEAEQAASIAMTCSTGWPWALLTTASAIPWA